MTTKNKHLDSNQAKGDPRRVSFLIDKILQTNFLDVKTIPESNEEMYPWSVQLMIEGMHGEHCAKRLESAFQKQGKIKAEVNFKNKIATIYAQDLIENEVIYQIVQQAGYAIVQMA